MHSKKLQKQYLTSTTINGYSTAQPADKSSPHWPTSAPVFRFAIRRLFPPKVQEF